MKKKITVEKLIVISYYKNKCSTTCNGCYYEFNYCGVFEKKLKENNGLLRCSACLKATGDL